MEHLIWTHNNLSTSFNCGNMFNITHPALIKLWALLISYNTVIKCKKNKNKIPILNCSSLILFTNFNIIFIFKKCPNEKCQFGEWFQWFNIYFQIIGFGGALNLTYALFMIPYGREFNLVCWNKNIHKSKSLIFYREMCGNINNWVLVFT